MIIPVLLQDPTNLALIALLCLTIVGLGICITNLIFERQSAQRNEQRHAELTNRLLDLEEELSKLEKLQQLASSRQQRVDVVLQDIYTLLGDYSRDLHLLKDKSTSVATGNMNDAPGQINYEHATRMAKEGMSAEQIQEMCGLSEGEVNLLMDLHKQ